MTIRSLSRGGAPAACLLSRSSGSSVEQTASGMSRRNAVISHRKVSLMENDYQHFMNSSTRPRECLNKSVFSCIRVSWPVDETPEPIGDVLSCQEMGILMPEPTVPAALRRLRTDSPHVRRSRRAPR